MILVDRLLGYNLQKIGGKMGIQLTVFYDYL